MHALVAVVAATLTANPAALDEFVAQEGQKLIDENVVVGMAIGTFERGATHVTGLGKLALDRDEAPDGHTIYEIASLTKLFTGILLADAVERGELKLDDPADQYLPDELKLPGYEDRSITLLDIARHNSGLPRLPTNFRPADWSNPYADYTADNLAEFLREHKLRRAPGSQYEYSNLAFGILGQLLARRAGLSYEALVQERICRPLAMRETAIELNEAARARLAAPFDAALKPAANWEMPMFQGGGALRSTADDMLKFLAANVGRPAPQAERGNGAAPVQDAQATATAAPPHPSPLPEGEGTSGTLAAAIRAAQTPRGDTTLGPEVKVGLAWHLNTSAGTMFHSGQTGGYHTFIAAHAGKQVGVVVLANTATEKVDELAVKILVRLLERAE